MKKILLILGREALYKDSFFYQEVISNLDLHGFDIVFDPLDRLYFIYSKLLSKWSFRGKWKLFFLFKITYLALVHRNLLDIYLRLTKQIQDIELRRRIIEQYVKRSIREEDRLIVLGRSAGGIVITSIADRIHVDHIICISYPFKHPDKDDENYRTTHLGSITNPTLILQGARDEYGGREVVGRYPTSKHVSIQFFDTDHSFNLEEADLRIVKKKIELTLAQY